MKPEGEQKPEEKGIQRHGRGNQRLLRESHSHRETKGRPERDQRGTREKPKGSKQNRRGE